MPSLTLLVGLIGAAAVLSALLIALLFPLMRRYALARPNARSSHRVPTPQGGGAAVLLSAIVVCGLLAAWPEIGSTGLALDGTALIVVLATATVLAVTGAVDDIRPLSPLLRLALQAGAAICVVSTVPEGTRVLPEFVPWIVERAVLVVGTVWFVNLVNFMDGIDGLTVAEGVPVALGTAAALTAAMLISSVAGGGPDIAVADANPVVVTAIVLACALAGALLGFWPHNAHPAKLFLGDVGSLPVGLILAWTLIVLAANGHLAAAVALPLYYLADATLTLVWRARRGERVWEAHRRHFYQRAVDSRRFTAPDVTRRVWALNLLLTGLAILMVWLDGALWDATLFTLALGMVAAFLQHLRRGIAR